VLFAPCNATKLSHYLVSLFAASLFWAAFLDASTAGDASFLHVRFCYFAMPSCAPDALLNAPPSRTATRPFSATHRRATAEPVTTHFRSFAALLGLMRPANFCNSPSFVLAFALHAGFCGAPTGSLLLTLPHTALCVAAPGHAARHHALQLTPAGWALRLALLFHG